MDEDVKDYMKRKFPTVWTSDEVIDEHPQLFMQALSFARFDPEAPDTVKEYVRPKYKPTRAVIDHLEREADAYDKRTN